MDGKQALESEFGEAILGFADAWFLEHLPDATAEQRIAIFSETLIGAGAAIAKALAAERGIPPKQTLNELNDYLERVFAVPIVPSELN